ncbi:Gfo/Idh/MocA family protein [Rhizobium leguminosarum]|uniref:Gfo/Idh/MocA family protein n=1 Tax=Rhizobium leguminosarum TaxID=384 RepID=UPI0004B114FB|nr:Gfo/Idh/MocA family oxidoreductase [Rhizobium leguminosarum]
MSGFVGKPRIGIVGVGWIGYRHAKYCASHAGCELVGISDPGPAASKVGAELGVPSFASAEDLLDNVKPDGVIIATPTQLHLETAGRALERGVGVLIEKPIADTVANARILVELARRYDTPILVGHHRRHNSAVRETRRLLSKGDIGRLLAVNVLWAVKKPDDYFDVSWRREKGAGPVLINLIHEIDLLRHLCGEIETVSAIVSSEGRGNSVEDTVVAMLKFKGGAIGTITASDASPAPWSWDAATGENPLIYQGRENPFRFLGSEGSMEFPDLFIWRYVDQAKPGWLSPISRESRVIQQNEAYIAQLEHFCRVIRREEAPLIDGEDGLRTLVATLSIHDAATTGIPVTIPRG